MLYPFAQLYTWAVVGRDRMVVGFLTTYVIDWFSPGTLVSFTNKTDRHDNWSWNIVESGVKHHNPNP